MSGIGRRENGPRTWRTGLAVLTSIALGVGALLALPAAATAQVPALDAARQFLGSVPVKSEQLSVYADAVGDVDGADAEWGASGQVEVDDKLRTWLKDLVEGEYGWGQLPARGDEVLIVFVKLAEAPRYDGDQTAVLHLGLAGGGDVSNPSAQADLADGVRLIHSAGLWYGDGRFFPQNGSSPVTAGGVSWFADPANGAGGIVMPDGVLVNVVRPEKWTRRYRLTVEGTKPFSDPPAPPTRDVVYAPGGNQYQFLGGMPDLDFVACVSANVGQRDDGSRQVEMNVQASSLLSGADLTALSLETYDAQKELLGLVEGTWTSYPGLGFHRGLFTIEDSQARSAAVTPLDGGRVKGELAPVQRIAMANRTGLMGLDGMGTVLGSPDCGRLRTDLEMCDAEVAAAISETGLFEGAGTRLRLTPRVTADGSIGCEIAVDGEPAAVLLQGVQPVGSSRDVQTIAEASGCEAVEVGKLTDSTVVSCDSFVAWFWRQAIPALAWADLDGGLGVVQSILLYRPLRRGPAGGDEPPDADLPTLLSPLSDLMIAAAEGADFSPAVPPVAEVG